MISTQSTDKQQGNAQGLAEGPRPKPCIDSSCKALSNLRLPGRDRISCISRRDHAQFGAQMAGGFAGRRDGLRRQFFRKTDTRAKVYRRSIGAPVGFPSGRRCFKTLTAEETRS